MLSLAQLLPTVVLEGIVDYVVEEYSQSSLDFPPNRRNLLDKAKPLLSVCSAWRDAALNKLYRDVSWCMSVNPKCCYNNVDRDLCVPKSISVAVETGNIARIRNVSLHFICSSILDGFALVHPRVAPFIDLVLPRVTGVEFKFDEERFLIHQRASSQRPEYVKVFCDKINRMFPNATSRAITKFDYPWHHKSRPSIQALAFGLFANAIANNLSVKQSDGSVSLPTTIHNLHRISIGYAVTMLTEVEIIRRNAGTLEYLDVAKIKPALFTKVAVLDDGTLIAYPYLKSLEFSLLDHDDTSVHSHLNSPAGILFPSLEKLVCHGEYPFGNDVLFRGNEHKLKYLDIHIHPQTEQVMNSYGLFGSERFPLLKYAHAHVPKDSAEEDNLAAVKIFLQLGANARTLKIIGGDVSFSTLGMTNGYFGQDVTVLDLLHVKFTHHEALELISRLPCLEWLGISFELSDDLRDPRHFHDACLGECRDSWREKRIMERTADNLDDDASSYASGGSYGEYYQHDSDEYGYVRDFLYEHLDIVYANMEFVDELYRQYYPLSKTLYFLDASWCSGEPLADCKIIAILTALCPTISRVKTNQADVDEDYERAISSEYLLERHEIEETEQHRSFVSRLQLANH